MGRKYKGLDYTRVTARLDEDSSDIVSQYCRDHGGSGHVGDAVREAIKLFGAYMKMSDITETCCANLLDIAKVFDKINGPAAPTYAEALREAAFTLWVFHYDRNKKTAADAANTDDGKVEQGLAGHVSTSNNT